MATPPDPSTTLTARMDKLRGAVTRVRDAMPAPNDDGFTPKHATDIRQFLATTEEVLGLRRPGRKKDDLPQHLAALSDALGKVIDGLPPPDHSMDNDSSYDPPLERLRGRIGLLRIELDQASAAAGPLAVPHGTDVGISRAGNQGLVRGEIKRLNELDNRMAALEKRAAGMIVQQHGTVNLALNVYIPRMKTEISLAKLHLSVGVRVAMDGLGRAISRMVDLTEELWRVLAPLAGAAWTALRDGARAVNKQLSRVVRGAKAIGKWVLRGGKGAGDAKTEPTPWPPRTALSIWRDPSPDLPAEALPEMITLPAGDFLMGAPKEEEGSQDDERPQHLVHVPSFALGRYAVTFGQWDAAREAGADLRRPNDRGWGRGDRPVINVSWHDVQAYCAWLNNRLGLKGMYRLPTEAEWEYACRAGTITAFSSDTTISEKQVNYNEKRTTPVGSLPANAWGLHEMHGNVWEWVEDFYRNYDPAPLDGLKAVAWDEAARHVLRGGSFSGNPGILRSATRDRDDPDDLSGNVGFRLARTL